MFAKILALSGEKRKSRLKITIGRTEDYKMQIKNSICMKK